VITLLAVVTYGGSLAAVAAAFAAFMQASRTRETNTAQLFLSFSERYNSPEMAAAMRRLVKWRLEYKDNFAKVWEERRQMGDADAVELNAARRLVSRYYYDVARLHEVGLISSKFARALLSNNGLHVFYDICEPLNDARHHDRERRHAERLMRLLKHYGANRIHGP